MADFFSWASGNEYFLSWLIYLAGAAGCLLVAWRLSAAWPVWLGRAFRLFSAALLLPPATVEQGSYFLAPAFIVAPFEWFSYGPERAEPAISMLVLGAACAVALYVLTPLIGWLMGRISTKA